MENVIYDRLSQIAQTDLKVSLLSFKDNDKLFVDIVKKVCAFPEIADISEDAKTRKEKVKNVTIALKVLDMVTVDLNNIKAKHVLDANLKLNRLLKDLFFYYTDRRIRSYWMDTGDSTIENFRKWINTILYPDYDIVNFGSDWINPMTFGALLDKTKPGLCPKWQDLSSDLKLEITTDLMLMAEEYLYIKQIIKPEVMISGNKNDISVMIYLSQFLELKEALMPIFTQESSLNNHKKSYSQLPLDMYLHPKKSLYEEIHESSRSEESPIGKAVVTPDRGRPRTLQDAGMTRPRDSSDSSQQTLVFKRESTPAVKYCNTYTAPSSGKDIFNKPRNEQEFWEQMKDWGIEYRQELKESVEKGVLELGPHLRDGNFGKVFKCRFVPAGGKFRICALKTIKLEETGTTRFAKVVKDFIEEAWIAKCSHHKNVIRLLHFIFHDGLPCLVFPFYKNGDLESYLRKNKPVDVAKLVSFSIDVTNGLKYLQDCGYIHRDIAARNCLVTDEETVVLADFGLSRSVLSGIYTMQDNNAAVPWRTLPPEVLSSPQKEFSTTTDVWSLGILLWQIFSHGELPFNSMLNMKQLRKFLESGQRLDRPPYGSDDIYQMMKRCWDENPRNRPSFNEILKTLELSQVYDDVYSD